MSTVFHPKIQFEAIIAVELMSMNQAAMAASAGFLWKGAEKRRDIWPSTDQAYEILKSRKAWKIWDDRVLKIYVVSVLQIYPIIRVITNKFLGIYRTKVSDRYQPQHTPTRTLA